MIKKENKNFLKMFIVTEYVALTRTHVKLLHFSEYTLSVNICFYHLKHPWNRLRNSKAQPKY